MRSDFPISEEEKDLRKYACEQCKSDNIILDKKGFLFCEDCHYEIPKSNNKLVITKQDNKNLIRILKDHKSSCWQNELIKDELIVKLEREVENDKS